MLNNTKPGYHNITAYQKAKLLAKQVISISDKLPKNRAFDAISLQLVRSSTSIGANLIEGYGRNNPREYNKLLTTTIKNIRSRN